jgi:hypothetical protein
MLVTRRRQELVGDVLNSHRLTLDYVRRRGVHDKVLEWRGHCGRADDYHDHATPVHLEKIVGKGKAVAGPSAEMKPSR